MRCIAAGLFLLLFACGSAQSSGPQPLYVTFAPERRAEVFPVVVANLQTQGYTIAFTDEASGAITTAVWDRGDRVMCGQSECVYRDTISVNVGTNGAVLVRVDRELDIGGTWQAATNSQQQAQTAQTQERISQAIAIAIGGETTRKAPKGK